LGSWGHNTVLPFVTHRSEFKVTLCYAGCSFDQPKVTCLLWAKWFKQLAGVIPVVSVTSLHLDIFLKENLGIFYQMKKMKSFPVQSPKNCSPKAKSHGKRRTMIS
jgi:hypothetical protein